MKQETSKIQKLVYLAIIVSELTQVKRVIQVWMNEWKILYKSTINIGILQIQLHSFIQVLEKFLNPDIVQVKIQAKVL
jgi:hypothetical protein